MALEGIDGSGKSTVQRLVARRLRARGHRVTLTQEPTRTALGAAVRRGIRGRLDPAALAFLFLADRAQHVRTLLERGKGRIVLTDRYADSTTAYQAAALKGRWRKPLETLSALQAAVFPRPDLTILLDLEPKAALARIRSRSVKEPFEKIRFLTGVRANYLRLARQQRFVVVDASRSAGKVADEVVRRIVARLPRGLQR